MFDAKAAQQALEENFAPWVLDLAPQVQDVGTGRAVLDIPVTPRIARVGGMVCGQAMGALADTAMVLACAAQLGEFRPVATTNLETRFLRAARGEVLRCTARIVKPGRALLFAEAELADPAEGKPVARASATFFLA